MSSDIDKLSRRYPPLQASDDTPMERFGVLSTANDPMSFITRMEMENAGLTHGSLETIKLRRNAAAAIVEAAGSVAMEVDSDDGSDTRPHETPNETRKEYRRAVMPSVGRPAVMRVRTKRKRAEKAMTKEKRRM